MPCIKDRDRWSWSNFYTEIRRRVFPLLDTREQQWTQRLFEGFLNDERNFEFEPVLIHGDLSPDHILFDREKGVVTGIIDFGDMHIGDPAYDFQRKLTTGKNFGRLCWLITA